MEEIRQTDQLDFWAYRKPAILHPEIEPCRRGDEYVVVIKSRKYNTWRTARAKQLPDGRWHAYAWVGPKPGTTRTVHVDGKARTDKFNGVEWELQPPAKTVQEAVARVMNLNTGPPRSPWTYPGHTLPLRQRRGALINHLLGLTGQPFHAGKFSRSQLEGLTLRQLENLHANDHEGAAFSVRRASPVKAKPVRFPTLFPTTFNSSADTYCPPGLA